VAGQDRLVEALETDLEWRDQHTRIAGRAREWLDSGRDSSYALRGADLREAEAWLAGQAGHRQAPTREQAEYISFSRQAASRRLYALGAALATGLVVAIALAVIALVHRASANREAHVAQSQLLASQAVNTTDPELAWLLAVGAYEISPTIDAKSAILTVADTGDQGILSTGNAGVYAMLSAPVTAVAFNPEGTLTAAKADGTVQIWDLATHRRLSTLAGAHQATVFSAALSRDGRTLAALGDGGLRLWDVATGHELRSLVGPERGTIVALAFSPHGTTLAAAGVDGKLWLWDVRTGRELDALTPGGTAIAGDGFVAFAPDGKTLAIPGTNGAVWLWSLSTHHRLGKPLIVKTGVQSVVFSPDGQTLAIAGSNQGIRLWNLKTRRQLGVLAGNGSDVYGMAFSRDGRTLASANADGTVRLWDLTPPRQVGNALTANGAGVNGAAFSRNGTTIASASADGKVRLWSLATHHQLGAPLKASGGYEFLDSFTSVPQGLG
jgi:WD40 domain-containing protein